MYILGQNLPLSFIPRHKNQIDQHLTSSLVIFVEKIWHSCLLVLKNAIITLIFYAWLVAYKLFYYPFKKKKKKKNIDQFPKLRPKGRKFQNLLMNNMLLYLCKTILGKNDIQRIRLSRGKISSLRNDCRTGIEVRKHYQCG